MLGLGCDASEWESRSLESVMWTTQYIHVYTLLYTVYCQFFTRLSQAYGCSDHYMHGLDPLVCKVSLIEFFLWLASSKGKQWIKWLQDSAGNKDHRLANGLPLCVHEMLPILVL